MACALAPRRSSVLAHWNAPTITVSVPPSPIPAVQPTICVNIAASHWLLVCSCGFSLAGRLMVVNTLALVPLRIHPPHSQRAPAGFTGALVYWLGQAQVIQ